MTLLYSSPQFAKHHTGLHPENANRLVPIEQQLQSAAPLFNFRRPPWQPITSEQLQRVHAATYIDEVREFAVQGGGYIEQDTVLSPDSFNVALLAAGAAVDAVQRVLRGEDNNAFCLMRPPGHHALPQSAMGFCLFNNAAVAARAALAEGGLDRVLIIDWDVHHGNGTQDTFWEDPQVGFYSVHRSPFYPGTGLKYETGARDGLGSTCNVPLAFGISRTDYIAAFQNTVQTFADHFRPQLIILSAGFDSHVRDPVGSLGLESEDFTELTRIVLDIAKTHTQGKLVSLLEGGYNPQALAESIEAHLRELCKLA